MKIGKFFLLSFLVLFTFSKINATDLTPTQITSPGSQAFVGAPFYVEFTIRNQNILTAPGNRWTVVVEIRNVLNQLLWTETVQGVTLAPYTTVDLTTTGQYTPTGIGTHTVTVDINHLDEINPSNDVLSNDFFVNDAPTPITNISPTNGGSDVPFENTPFSWTNGSYYFTQTNVFINTQSSTIDWNASPTITSTVSTFNSFTYAGPLPQQSQVTWGVQQVNPAGTTNNGPFQFFTDFDQPGSITDIFPPDFFSGVSPTQSLDWMNGDAPVSQTNVFVWPSPTTPDWNGTPVLSTTVSDYNSYTPSMPWDYDQTYRWGVQQINDKGTTNNGPFTFFTQVGPPSSIFDIDPFNGATNVSPDQPLGWTNGENPITETRVFVWPYPSSADWNGTPVVTSGLPDFNSYTPSSPFQSNTLHQWGVQQINNYGTTNNGPFEFTTALGLPPDDLSNINPVNGATNVPLDQPLSWTNGTNQFDQTQVHVWPSQSAVDWNSGGVFTSTASDYHSYSPPSEWDPLTNYWWGVLQTNNNGTTQNGPFSFTTTYPQADLATNRIVSPQSTVTSFFDIFVQIEVNNLGPSTASGWSIPFTIKNSSNQTVFNGTIPGTSLSPNSSTIVTFETPWYTDLPGSYSLFSNIQYGNDPNQNNNNNIFNFEVVPRFQGATIQPGQGVNFFQIDFTFDDAPQDNSPYGMIATDHNQIAAATGVNFGYINCYSDVLGWFVQNMLFDPSLQLGSSYSGLSSLFNLEDLQTPTDPTVEQIDANVFLSDEPLYDFISTDFSTFTVEKRPYNTEKVLEPTGTIPAPLKFENIPFVEGGKSDLVWQHGHVSIEQDKNQCAPTAVANSLQWLENKGEITVPHEHKPGIRDNSLVGQLDQTMNRTAHEGSTIRNVHEGKLKYISDNNLSNKLKIKHKNHPGKNYLSNDTVKVGNAKSIPNTDTTLSLIDWMISELKDGEDVELSITWEEGGGGHVIDLIGGGYVDGVPWISWVHDANQGYDDNGTAGNTADDKTKMNGGISPDSGGVGWSYIINNRLASVIMGDTAKAYLKYAISESKDTTSTDIENIYHGLPTGYKLYQNFPNPFNPSTTIKFEVPKVSFVRINLYDGLGKEILRIANGVFSAGTHIIKINIENLASGIYYYTMEGDNFKESKKLILLK
ncbi:MAG: T9SS type A sorting domain-containing protein [Bacteroidota bacterium]